MHNVNVRRLQLRRRVPAAACGVRLPSSALQRLGNQDRLGHRRRREGQPAVWWRGRRLPGHRRLHPERGVVLGSAGRDVGRERPGQRQRPADVSGRRVLQPAHQPVVDADRLVGHAPCSSITSRRSSTSISKVRSAASTGATRAAAASVASAGGCGSARRHRRAVAEATTWIIGADIGWNPVTNLNFDLELMYQSTNQDRPSGFLGTVYNDGAGGALRPGRLGRQLERLRRPSPHHPLLLIATRSVETEEPRSESSGVFLLCAQHGRILVGGSPIVSWLWRTKRSATA